MAFGVDQVNLEQLFFDHWNVLDWFALCNLGWQHIASIICKCTNHWLERFSLVHRHVLLFLWLVLILTEVTSSLEAFSVVLLGWFDMTADWCQVSGVFGAQKLS